MQDDDDKLAALERRVADLEQIPGHGPELQQIRSGRELAAREVDGRLAAEDARDKERLGVMKRVRLTESNVRHTIGGVREVLKYARILAPSDATLLRNAVPPLETIVETLRALVERDPWPEGVAQLDESAERESAAWWLAEARAVLAAFDSRYAEQEARRRRRVS